MDIKIKRLHQSAVLPRYQTEGAACFDLHACNAVPLTVSRNQPAVIPTGLQFEIPKGHVMLIFSRSGHGFKDDVSLSNCVGVIDSDYRGEVMVKLRQDPRLGVSPFTVAPGDRIAQAMVIEARQVNIVEVDELSTTERGNGGFGSTGK